MMNTTSCICCGYRYAGNGRCPGCGFIYEGITTSRKALKEVRQEILSPFKR